MKTKIKRISRRTLSMIMCVLMIFSTMIVGTITTASAYDISSGVTIYYLDTDSWNAVNMYYWGDNWNANVDYNKISNTNIYYYSLSSTWSSLTGFKFRSDTNWTNQSDGNITTSISSNCWFSGTSTTSHSTMANMNGTAKVISMVSTDGGSTYTQTTDSSCVATVSGYTVSDGSTSASSVSASTGSDSSASISAAYGSTISYSATAASGYTFEGFSTTNSSSLPSSVSSTASQTATGYNGSTNTTYYAYFTEDTVNIGTASDDVLNGDSVMFYIRSYTASNNVTYGLTNGSTGDDNFKSATTFSTSTATAYITLSTSDLSSYTYITNNGSSWAGEQNSDIANATGGELFVAASSTSTTSAPTASTTLSVDNVDPGDTVTASSTTSATTSVVGKNLYLQYYLYDGSTNTLLTTMSASSLESYNIDTTNLVEGTTYTVKTVLTDGYVFYVADTDTFTVSIDPSDVTIYIEGRFRVKDTDGNYVYTGSSNSYWSTSSTNIAFEYVSDTLYKLETNCTIAELSETIGSDSNPTQYFHIGSKTPSSSSITQYYPSSGTTFTSTTGSCTLSTSNSSSYNMWFSGTDTSGPVTIYYDSSTGELSYEAIESTYTVTIEAQTGGSVSPSGEQTVGSTTTTEITATENDGYVFIGWTSENDNVTFADASSATTTITASGDDTVTAKFVKVYKITLNAVDNAEATVTYTDAFGDEQTLAEGESAYAQSGTTATVNVTVDSGYKIDSVTADETALDSPYEFEVSEATTVTVTVSKYPVVTISFSDCNVSSYTCTYTRGGSNRNLTSSATSYSIMLDKGCTFTITATMNDGYKVDSWSGGGDDAAISNNNLTYSFTVTGDTTVTLASHMTPTIEAAESEIYINSSATLTVSEGYASGAAYTLYMSTDGGSSFSKVATFDGNVCTTSTLKYSATPYQFYVEESTSNYTDTSNIVTVTAKYCDLKLVYYFYEYNDELGIPYDPNLGLDANLKSEATKYTKTQEKVDYGTVTDDELESLYIDNVPNISSDYFNYSISSDDIKECTATWDGSVATITACDSADEQYYLKPTEIEYTVNIHGTDNNGTVTSYYQQKTYVLDAEDYCGESETGYIWYYLDKSTKYVLSTSQNYKLRVTQDTELYVAALDEEVTTPQTYINVPVYNEVVVNDVLKLEMNMLVENYLPNDVSNVRAGVVYYSYDNSTTTTAPTVYSDALAALVLEKVNDGTIATGSYCTAGTLDDTTNTGETVTIKGFVSTTMNQNGKYIFAPTAKLDSTNTYVVYSFIVYTKNMNDYVVISDPVTASVADYENQQSSSSSS